MYGAPERHSTKKGPFGETVILATHPALDRNLSVAMAALMHLARLKGYVVEKKQTLAGRVDLGKLGAADLRAVLTGHLNELDPDSRRQVEAIAAGDVDLVEADTADE